MDLLVISIQSVTDVVTNSSSEVFVLDTDKSCEQVHEILEKITEGFEFPQVFHLDEYREWRNSKEEKLGTDYPYYDIFDIAENWFVDPKNEEDMYNFKRDFLFMPWSEFPEFGITCYSPNTFLPVHEALVEYINDHWGKLKKFLPEVSGQLNKQLYLKYKYAIRGIPDRYIREFIDNYKEPVYGWELDPEDNVENLDGKILVMSTDDNSIPHETWKTIYENFSGFNKHLG